MNPPEPSFYTHSLESTSNTSLRRFSSNNPFRTASAPLRAQTTGASGSAFDEWVDKNRRLYDTSSDDEDLPLPAARAGHRHSPSAISPPALSPPGAFTRPLHPRAGSEGSLRHASDMSNKSNNPFHRGAAAAPDTYRPAPPIPLSATKPSKDLPPTYEEAAGRAKAKARYAQEKAEEEARTTRLAAERETEEERRTRKEYEAARRARKEADLRARAAEARARRVREEQERDNHGQGDEKRDGGRARETEAERRARKEREAAREAARGSETDAARRARREAASTRPRETDAERRARKEKEAISPRPRETEAARRARKDKTRSKSALQVTAQGEKPKNIDTIDKLDVTGFHSFHHDGPFDACTPARNKKGGKLAPVNAFPIDGPNSTIKGMGFANAGSEAEAKSQTMDRMFGQTNFEDESPRARTNFNRAHGTQSTDSVTTLEQYNQMKKEYNTQITSFDPTLKAEPVHGDTTYGLGSLTFLEGAPAPRNIQFEDPGLGRKKSLSQRLRKNSADAARGMGESDAAIDTGNSLLRRVKSLKVSRRG